MKKLKRGLRIPCSAYTVPDKAVKGYIDIERAPKVGDLLYGEVAVLGQHRSLENGQGRIHTIHLGTRAVFVFGNRYAPDYYGGLIPSTHEFDQIDPLARSGVVGHVVSKSEEVISPTVIKPPRA